MKRSDAYRILTTRGWLSEINPELASALFQAGRLMELRKGQVLYDPGGDPGGMYAVVKGGVIMSSIGRDGVPVAGHVFRQCSWFGYASVIDRRPRALMPMTSEPSLVLHVPLAEINAIRESFPTAITSFRELLILGEYLYVAIVTDLLISNTDHRLAAVLLRVTGAATPERPEQLPVDPLMDHWASPDGVLLTQAMLAELANASSHTVSRFVERIVKAGWIDWRYRRVRIRDAPALAAFAAGKLPAM
jgi:CRP-like cAMP-binding protein